MKDNQMGDLFRRTISKALQTSYGWTVKTHVDGTIDVWMPGRGNVEDSNQKLRAAVRSLGYEPTIVQHPQVNEFIRFHTPETVAQQNMGAHGSAVGMRPRQDGK